MLEYAVVGDLGSIRSTLRDALAVFADMHDGDAWDGGLTNDVPQACRAMVIDLITKNLDAMSGWLDDAGAVRGELTLDEYTTLADFIVHWSAEELTNDRYRNPYRDDTLTDLATVRLNGRPIPTLRVPVRGRRAEDQPTFVPADVSAAGGASIPVIMPTGGPIQTPPLGGD